MISVVLGSLRPEQISDAVALDRLIFGGLWSQKSYETELNRESSTLMGAWTDAADTSLKDAVHAPASVELFLHRLPLIALGCTWGIEDEVHLTLLGVHPQFQKRYLGQALLLQLLTLARQWGANYGTLEVSAANAAAIQLYQKFGFKTAGRRPNYYASTGEDALIMWRSGLQSAAFAQQLQDCWQQINVQWQQWGWQYRPEK